MPANRITDTFARARSENRAAFIAYLCAGDPDFDTSLAACRAVLDNGVDILELGVPFSDPVADGLTNQLAAQRALESGITAGHVLELTARLRAEYPATPLVFYTYYNLIFAHGVENYVARAAAAGLDALLALDLPPEESAELAAACARHNLKLVYIVAPTTPDARIAKIAAAATGFLYYASREGVTGVRDQLAADIPAALARIKTHTSLPVVVGFGISTRAHVSSLAPHADGIVVGSALVNCIRDTLDNCTATPAIIGAKARDLSAGAMR
jgi:tryptophan synthase alpha chain